MDLDKIMIGLKPELEDNLEYMPLLHMAVASNSQEIVEALLKSGADPNILDVDGWTPLQIAVISNFQQVVRILLKNGADINARNKIQIKVEDKIKEYLNNTALHIAVIDENLDMVRILLDNGANSGIKNQKGNIPLHIAVQAEVDKSIYLKGIKNNALLIYDRETKKLNIKNLINRQIHESHQVSQKLKLPCNVRIIETLLKHNTIIGQQGAFINEHNYAGYSPIHSAVKNDNLDAAKVLLSDPRIDVNIGIRTGEETALMLAVTHHFHDMIKLLLDHNHNIRSGFGYTAFELALIIYYPDNIIVTLWRNIEKRIKDGTIKNYSIRLEQDLEVEKRLDRLKKDHGINLRPIVEFSYSESESEESDVNEESEILEEQEILENQETEPEQEISEIEVEEGPSAKRARLG